MTGHSHRLLLINAMRSNGRTPSSIVAEDNRKMMKNHHEKRQTGVSKLIYDGIIYIYIYISHTRTRIHTHTVCVCVCEREREREREAGNVPRSFRTERHSSTRCPKSEYVIYSNCWVDSLYEPNNSFDVYT